MTKIENLELPKVIKINPVHKWVNRISKASFLAWVRKFQSWFGSNPTIRLHEVDQLNRIMILKFELESLFMRLHTFLYIWQRKHNCDKRQEVFAS